MKPEETRKEVLCKVPPVICDVIQRVWLHHVESGAHEVAPRFYLTGLLLEFRYHAVLVEGRRLRSSAGSFTLVRTIVAWAPLLRWKFMASLSGISRQGIRLSHQKGLVKQVLDELQATRRPDAEAFWLDRVGYSHALTLTRRPGTP